MDEAGTSGSRQEKTRIVAAVILHADKELMLAEAMLEEALTAVPPEFAAGFVFHAEDIINNDKYRASWRLTDRVSLIKDVISIPGKLGTPICIGQVWATAPTLLLDGGFKGTPNQEHHFWAFRYCVAQADKWIRENAEVGEVGTIVAEQCDIKKVLGTIPAMLRQRSHVFGPDHLLWTAEDKAQGFCSQDGVLRVTRIRKAVHFVDKTDDPLVWIADACAYGFKRYFSGQDFGDQFCQAALGYQLDISDFVGSMSGAILYPRIRRLA